MKNPYQRLLELTFLSQKDFGEKYHFSKTTMTYILSGQYPELSDRMIESLGQECHEKGVNAGTILQTEYSRSTLQEAYSAWQFAERVVNKDTFMIEPPTQYTDELSPFHFYIKATTGSLQGFAKTLKVPSVSVARYATGQRTSTTRNVRSMPDVLESAFKDIEYPYLGRLIELQSDWLAEHS